MARKNNEEANEQTVDTVNEVNMSEENKEEKKTIETWKKELSVKDWVFIGICESNNWASGKSVTKDEFNDKLNSFMKSKIGG
ncbi:MAG TPA: hypothetical protein PK771_01505 [Spirochaetota bacterium]|nr:hypothetical protein [Spirochaetota bacterium]